MFCSKCGNLIEADDMFCGNCGAKIILNIEEEPLSDNESKAVHDDSIQTFNQNFDSEESCSAKGGEDMSFEADQKEETANKKKTFKNEFTDREKQGLNQNTTLFNRLWNHPAFTKFAIIFDRFGDWFWAVVSFGFMVLFFTNGGFWNGVIVLTVFLGAVGNIARRNQKKKKARTGNTTCPNCGKWVGTARFCPECGAAMPQPEVEDKDDGSETGMAMFAENKTLRRKKINVLLTIFAIIIAIVLWSSLGTSNAVYQIKNADLPNWGTETIETVVENKMQRVKWDSEEIDDGYSLVYVNGYMPLYGENVRLVFSYEEFADDTFSYELIEVDLTDSGVRMTDIFSMATFLTDLYS